MAEPLRDDRVYDPNDEKPVIRARLQGIEGGGEGDGKAAGALSAVSPQDLDGAERSPLHSIDGGGEGDGKAAGNLSAVDGKEQGLLGDDHQVGRGFTAIDKFMPPQTRALAVLASLFTKKRAARGGMIGGAVGLVVLVGSITQGPMQVIQFAQILKNSHLTARQDETNSRLRKIGKYIYHTRRGGGVERLRLGVLGNVFADRIESKLNKSGIETLYTSKHGYRVGYAIDPDNLAGTDLEQYRTYDSKGNIDYDRTTKRIMAAVEREIGVKPTLDPTGKLLIDSGDSKLNPKQAKALQRQLLERAGYKESVAGIAARPMGKRAGLSWHPIKKLDRYLSLKTEDLYNKWKEDRKNTVKNGDSPRASSSGAAQNDPNTTADNAAAQNANDAGQAGQQAVNDANAVAQTDGATRVSKIEELTSTKSFKLTSGSTNIVGIACVIKGLADGADAVKQAHVILPAMRIAGDFIALGSQVQSGEDLDMKQVGFFVKQMNGIDSSGNTSSWTNAETTRAELGKTGGVKASDTLKKINKGSPFDAINQGALGTATKATCGTVGTFVTTVIGFATGPVGAIVGGLASVLAGPIIMNQVVDWISGSPLNPLPVGADLGNTGNFGAHLMARNQGASTGGRELSSTESAQIRQSVEDDSRSEFAQRSLKDRLLDNKDYRSFASQVVNSGQLSPKGLASTIASPFGALSKFGSQITGLTSAKAKAAGSYDYGFPDVGFSQDELNNDKIDNPFKNAEQVTSTILPAHPEYINRANKCYGVGVDPTSYDVTSLQASNPDFKVADDADCNDKSDDYLQFRAYILDTNTMMSLACLESNDSDPNDAAGTQACADLGFGSGNTATSQASASTGDLNIQKLPQPIQGSSCNCDITPKGITLHWWGFGGAKGTGIQPLVDAFKSNGLSVQIGITSDGDVWQMTKDLTTKANQAIGANNTTIGIEIAGDAPQFGKKGIENYPEKFDAVVKTVKFLVNKYNIPLDGQVVCDDVVGIHPHKAYNSCPGAVHKDDIDDYYFNEVMKRVRGQ